MPVLTISSQLGAGAREVGRRVAERLQIDLVDQQILVERARTLGVSTESVVSIDEQAESPREPLAKTLLRFLRPSASPGAGDASHDLDALLGRTYDEAAGEETSIDAVASAVNTERPDLRPHAAPDGTVTLLFADIENSTPITERLGDQRWLELLRAHKALVGEQVHAHGGFEVKSEGDGFMVAFGSARRALHCAIAIQRAMARSNERAEEPLSVRVGLHTGEVIKEADDFYGRHVNLASRIANEARGGEILVSSLLKDLADNAGDIRFGEPRELELKGFAGTYRVFSVLWSSHEATDERYASVLAATIRGLAARDNLLIIGRGSQMILRDWPGVLHVLLVASLDHRAASLGLSEGLTVDEAVRRLHDSDRSRAAFHRKFFKVDVDDPLLYHLSLDMTRVSFEAAAGAIVELARGLADTGNGASSQRRGGDG